MANEWRRWLRATTAAISIGGTVRPLTAAAAQPQRTFHSAPHLLGPDERLVWTPEPLEWQHRAPLVLSLPPSRQAPAFLDDSGGLSPLAIAGIVVGGVVLAVGIVYLVAFMSALHSSGRPYRAGGTQWLPAVRGRRPTNPLAEHWVSSARGEWASVPAFLSLAAELRAVGAPAMLVDAATAAARDEIAHARTCLRFAVAAGARVALHPMPIVVRSRETRDALIATLGREAWLDGCCAEATAAAALLDAARAARDERTRLALLRMGSEENRHAELAWAIARWCWSDGARARDAVMDAPAPDWLDTREVGDEDSLAAAGKPSGRVLREAWARTTDVALARRARLGRVSLA
jgi:hypothetical protein